MRIGILISARCGSTRLPQKHLQLIRGRPAMHYLLRRIEACFADEMREGTVVLAIAAADEPENRRFEHFASDSVRIFYGSIHNLPLRHLQAAKALDLDAIIAIDGDNLMISRAGMRAVWEALDRGVPYVKTTGLPLGLNVFGYARAFLSAAATRHESEILETGWGRIFDISQLKTIPYRLSNSGNELRFTLDYPEDLEFFRALFDTLDDRYLDATDAEIVDLVREKKLRHNAEVNKKYWINFKRKIAEEKSSGLSSSTGALLLASTILRFSDLCGEPWFSLIANS